MNKPYDLDDSDRQMLVLGLALTSLLRPGWKYVTGEIAKKLGDQHLKLFDAFRFYNSQVQSQGDLAGHDPNIRYPLT